MKTLKSTICILFGVMCLLTMTACGKGNPDNQGGSGQTQPAAGMTAGSEGAGEEQEVILFGKVGEIIGNQLTIQLADMPGPPEETQEETGSGREDFGDVVAAVEMVPAQAAGTWDGGSAMEITFTGESVTVDVPAGLDIRDSAGQQMAVTNISKGDVLQFSVDNKDDLNLKSITVVG